VQGRRIILGVTGSIAAYKAAEIVRALKKEGAEVRVVMTEAATRFVAPLTFEVLSGRRALTSLWEDAGDPLRLESADGGMAHLESSVADLVIVAPATANTIGKAANGIGDDLLSSLLLAANCPVIIAPAMNVNMLESPAVIENIERLKRRGWRVLEPDEGELACGVEGKGRLVPLETVMSAAREATAPSGPLAGTSIVVTAGRTEEPIDPVRYISNRSSGKMGFAVAKAALRRGARVTLVTGAVSVEPPDGVELVSATSAKAMAKAVKSAAFECDALIMAAAVADFRPSQARDTKMKKTDKDRPDAIPIEYTEDVLKEVAGSGEDRVTVGFSLEMSEERERARKKLQDKSLDLIVLNNPEEPGCGFGSEDNKVTFLYPDGALEELPLMSKNEVAEQLLDRVEKLLNGR
jgi:phosphopantothenoylcysteine decarboxylase/phosphopantothenate--cysteine ligase